MWFIILWLCVGAVAGVAGFIGVIYALDTVDDKRLRARAAIAQERRDAEHRLQDITQSAMQEMLSIARRYSR